MWIDLYQHTFLASSPAPNPEAEQPAHPTSESPTAEIHRRVTGRLRSPHRTPTPAIAEPRRSDAENRVSRREAAKARADDASRACRRSRC